MNLFKRIIAAGNGAYAVVAVMLAIVAGILAWNATDPIDFIVYTVQGTSYAKGTVSSVESSTVSWDESSGTDLGTQKLKVRIETGSHAGETVEVTNDLAATHNIEVAKGSRVVVKVDDPKGSVKPFYSIFNYDRTLPIVTMLGVFALAIVAVGRSKGLKSLIGLVFSLFVIMGFLLPAIYHGMSPIAAGVFTAFIVTVLSMLLLNGATGKTMVAIVSTMLGVLAAVALYLVFSNLMRLSGYNLDQAEELLAIHSATGLDVGGIMFVGVLVSALGAVMDMCMSVAASLFEMHRLHPDTSAGQIIESGMNIGRDMIGTMCMTLILAFTGTAVASLLVMVSYGAQLDTLLASDYVATELLQSSIGAISVVLSVPITAAVSAWTLCRSDR